jgi:hypothetical protein
MKVDTKDIGCALALIAALGLLLVLLGKPISEGFGMSDVIQCDIYSPCPGFLKCINGFCAKTDPVPLTEREPVQVLPDGYPVPYSPF